MQRPLFPTCRVLKPPPLHCTSPLKPRKSRRRHCLIRRHIRYVFFFFFFVSFLTGVAQTSFPHMPGPQTPPSPPYLAPKPRKSRRRHCLIHRHASKDMFFFF